MLTTWSPVERRWVPVRTRMIPSLAWIPSLIHDELQEVRCVMLHNADSSSTASAVHLENVSVTYGGPQAALKGITLQFSRGSHVAIIGPNGAGKTTLFNAILGLVPLASGRIRIFGRPPHRARAQIAYIPQREEVDWQFPLTALDIALMGRVTHIGWRLSPRAADYTAAQSAMERVDMWAYRNTPISDLSGGQQQRLIIARALAQDAPLFLLDEPFNEVDVSTQELLLDLFDELAAAGRTLLVTTHDLELARRRFPAILFLNQSVKGYGEPSEVFTPQTLEKTYAKQVVNWDEDDALRSIIDAHAFSHDH